MAINIQETLIANKGKRSCLCLRLSVTDIIYIESKNVHDKAVM